MTKRPKLETVAAQAGVSLATASQVMRGTGRISDKTRKKVLKAAQDLHYVRDGRAASMRSGKNLEIGFVINQIANPFNAEVISGVSDRLGTEGYLVSVLDGSDDADRHARHLQAFIEGGRAGLLWVPASGTPQATIDMLTANRTPTVTFMRRLGGRVFDHVGIRDAEATASATAHLLGLGHRHIAYLGGQEDSPVRQDRIAGYLQTLGDHDAAAPVIWPCADNKLAGLTAMIALHSAHPEVTAVICNGDMVALGACLGLSRLGLEVAQDVSVVGFDDIADAQLATPPLTTMGVSPYQLGRKLASVLLDRIREPALPPSVAEVSAELVLRETTGPAQDAPPP